MFHLLHLKARFSILEFRAINWQRIMEFVLQSFIGASYFALTTFLIPLIDRGTIRKFRGSKIPSFRKFSSSRIFRFMRIRLKGDPN